MSPSSQTTRAGTIHALGRTCLQSSTWIWRQIRPLDEHPPGSGNRPLDEHPPGSGNRPLDEHLQIRQLGPNDSVVIPDDTVETSLLAVGGAAIPDWKLEAHAARSQ